MMHDMWDTPDSSFLSEDTMEYYDIEVKGIVEDIFLIDFYEKKTHKSILMNMEQLSRYIEHFESTVFSDVSHFNVEQDINYNCVRGLDNILIDNYIANVLIDNYNIVYDILVLGDGKISLCGISIVDMITKNSIDRLDLFFCCNLNEAEDLLSKIIQLVNDVVVYTGRSIIFHKYNIRISLDVYTSEDQILRSIGPNPERHGFNLKIGYFGTLSSIICLSLSIYPIDLDFNERDIGRYHSRGFKTLFYGLTQCALKIGIVPMKNGHITKSDSGDISCVFDDGVVDTIEPWTYENPVICDKETFKKIPNNLVMYKNISKPYISSEDWFIADNYKSYIAGISNDRYIMFANIRKQYNITIDVFALLCNYWLEAEVLEAKNRLLLLDN